MAQDDPRLIELAATVTRAGGREDQAASASDHRAAIGRFELIDQLGEGGMGVVWVARDTALERRVALKLVHPTRGASARARERMLREAQALARLSHDNVVAIYEADVWRDQVYVAMELVEGRTLADVQAHGDVSPLEAWALIEQAGRGLEAAHAAELVHRDFKPSNVLVRRDGMVKVCDFGLARVDDLPVDDGVDESCDDRLTLTGTVLGTPRYMAPEQHRGDVVDARADQFALCVVAYELLFGHSPFAGETYGELAIAVTEGEPREPRASAAYVPGTVWSVLRRGLASDPGARYASLTELLDSLDGAFEALRRPELACRQVIEQVWNDEAREAIRASFAASGRHHADAIWARICELFDRYADAWVDERAREQSSGAPMDMTVLGAGLGELNSIVELLAHHSDASIVDRAIDLAFSLPPAVTRRDHLARPGHEVAYRLLSTGRVYQHAGRSDGAHENLTAASQAATAVQAHGLVAEAHLMLAHLAIERADVDAAELELNQALEAAARAKDDATLAKAWGHMAYLYGELRGPSSQAELLCEVAEVAALRTQDALARSWVFNDIGVVHTRAGRNERALDYLQRSAALKEHLFGPEHPDVAATHTNIGRLLCRLDRVAEAQRILDHAAEVVERCHGPDSYMFAFTVDELGEAHLIGGDFQRALEVAERSATVKAAVLDERNPLLAQTLLIRADALIGLGRGDEARAVLDEVFSMLGDSADQLDLERAWFARARVTDDPELAREYAQRALGESGIRGDNAHLVGAVEAWLVDH